MSHDASYNGQSHDTILQQAQELQWWLSVWVYECMGVCINLSVHECIVRMTAYMIWKYVYVMFMYVYESKP